MGIRFNRQWWRLKAVELAGEVRYFTKAVTAADFNLSPRSAQTAAGGEWVAGLFSTLVLK